MLNIKFICLFIYILIFYLLNSLLLFGPVSIINLINENTGFCIKNIYLSSLSFFIKYFLNVEIFVNSNSLLEEITSDNLKQNILISNHLSEIDFLFFSFIINNVKDTSKFKYILMSKKILCYIMSGYSMSSLLSKDIYLDRDINSDLSKLTTENDCNLLYFFPEGTCFNKEKKIKSDLYTQQNQLISYKYHLYPRLTGIKYVLKYHKKYNNIYDMTLLYDTIDKEKYGESYKFEKFIYKFQFPKRIFININKYLINEYPSIKDLFEKIYFDKDKFVSDFNLNINKFKKLNYNILNGLLNFVIFIIFSFISIGLFIKFEFIRTFYLCELLSFYIYLFFFHK